VLFVQPVLGAALEDDTKVQKNIDPSKYFARKLSTKMKKSRQSQEQYKFKAQRESTLYRETHWATQ